MKRLLFILLLQTTTVGTAAERTSVIPTPRTGMNLFDRSCSFAFSGARSWVHFNLRYPKTGLVHRTPDSDPLPHAEAWQDKIFVVIPGWGVGAGRINLQRAYYPLARAIHSAGDAQPGVNADDVHIVGYDHTQPTARISGDLRTKIGELVRSYRARGDQRKFVVIAHSLGAYVGLRALVVRPYRHSPDGTPLKRGEKGDADTAEIELWREFDDFISIAGVSPFTGYDLNKFYRAQSLMEFNYALHSGWHQWLLGSRYSHLIPSPQRAARQFTVPEEGASTFERYIDRVRSLRISSLYSRQDGIINPWIAGIVPEGYAREIPHMGHIDAVAFYSYLYEAFDLAYSSEREGSDFYSLERVRELALQELQTDLNLADVPD